MAVSEAVVHKKAPIDGWLILIGVAVWLMGITSALTLVVDIIRIFVSTAIIAKPVTTILGIAQSTVSVLLLILFIKRKAIFVKLSVWFLAYLFVYGIYFVIAFHHPKVSFYSGLIYLPIYVVSAIYLLRSKRVKDTFVR